MNRRDMIGTLGALFATTLVPETNIKPSPKNDYVAFLDSIQVKLDANKPVDYYAIVDILSLIEPGIAYYYCREFYFNDKMRPYLDNADKLLDSIANFKSPKKRVTTKLFG